MVKIVAKTYVYKTELQARAGTLSHEIKIKLVHAKINLIIIPIDR